MNAEQKLIKIADLQINVHYDTCPTVISSIPDVAKNLMNK